MKYVVEEANRVMMRGCSVQVSRDQSWGEGGIPKMITFNHNNMMEYIEINRERREGRNQPKYHFRSQVRGRV